MTVGRLEVVFRIDDRQLRRALLVIEAASLSFSAVASRRTRTSTFLEWHRATGGHR